MSNSFEMGPVDVKSVDSVRGSSVRGRTDSPPFLADEAVMNRMGATQELRRNFASLSILGMSITLLSSWEGVANSLGLGLQNGGPSSLIWGMVLSLSGVMCLALSLAEMASICPISGAQYHWTALFAPPRIRNFMTWMQGWITVFAWQAACTSICFVVATQIQGLVILNDSSYTPKRWHGTLLAWAVCVLTFTVNVYGIRFLPTIQVVGGLCHVIFFLVLIVPLVLLAPRSTADFVFTAFLNEAGWKSDGVSWCVGLITVTFCFMGFDGAVHMSEEVRNSSIVIPKMLVQTILINGSLAFIFAIVILFTIGNIDQALSTSTGYPIIEVFYQATGSKKAATLMLISIIIVGVAGSMGVVASVSRLTWAFARDGGLPLSSFFAHIDPKRHVPYRAIGLVCMTVALLSLINIGSSTALSAILGISTTSIVISYIIPISLLILKRLRNEPIPFGSWRLGRWGLPVNLYAATFGIFISVFALFPTTIPVTAPNMNYAGPILLGLIILASLDWLIRGRRGFKGPLKEMIQSEERMR
ncbi:hypothetical protein M430DRAFT_142583 [Amorphotheca resinae ATCC 22711]|uniref:Uncharacterized protein n=1 Tax=Amorphotheca resinae ATCC 22711 TaxID=857342 RepID=A0A2T3AYL5_AMORE|nr:hypothetical protein M430DRAFT_142583 [Amorphotheca resinae ATCC 22711]PSS15140.1 hypothetical protein M430DRAFT_142583 [Amorphotheca resinae ATCC 22711]